MYSRFELCSFLIIVVSNLCIILQAGIPRICLQSDPDLFRQKPIFSLVCLTMIDHGDRKAQTDPLGYWEVKDVLCTNSLHQLSKQIVCHSVRWMDLYHSYVGPDLSFNRRRPNYFIYSSQKLRVQLLYLWKQIVNPVKNPLKGHNRKFGHYDKLYTIIRFPCVPLEFAMRLVSKNELMPSFWPLSIFTQVRKWLI